MRELRRKPRGRNREGKGMVREGGGGQYQTVSTLRITSRQHTRSVTAWKDTVGYNARLLID